MNSSVAFWPSAAFAEVRAVLTTIPSCAVIVQPAWSFGIPSTSTRHMRQAPTARPEPRLVAEDRDLDPGRERRLDEARALRHLDLAPSIVTRDELGARAHDAVSLRRGSASVCACWSTGREEAASSDDSPPNGQPPWSMCAWNSSRNLSRSSRPASRPRRRAGTGTCRGSGRRRRAAGRARPASRVPSSIARRICTIQRVPSRHGVHLPHDSCM